MAAQAPREVRLAAADDVVLNDGSVTLQQLSANINRLHAAWSELAGNR
jgi:dephospho-CoA kinase